MGLYDVRTLPQIVYGFYLLTMLADGLRTDSHELAVCKISSSAAQLIPHPAERSCTAHASAFYLVVRP